MLPELPSDIVRKIFAYNIQRNVDRYDVDSATLYNIRPNPIATYQFLLQFNDEFRAAAAIRETYGYLPEEIYDEVYAPLESNYFYFV